MIGYFPNAYEDELFYNICARYGMHTAIPTVTGVMQSLFERRHAVAVVDLPNHLDSLVSRLPIGTQLTVDRIIEQHSLFTMFQPFINSKACNQIRRFMKSDENSSIRTRCGVCSNRVKPPSYFRTCPVCDQENRENHGETYWNRLFQIAGVEVCPKHEIFLAETDVPFQPLANRHCFVAADSARSNGSTNVLDIGNHQHKVLLQLANDFSWILHQSTLNPGFDFIHQRYHDLLDQHSLLTKGGVIRVSELKRRFIDHFTPELLAFLQSSISADSSHGWIERMLRGSRNALAP